MIKVFVTLTPGSSADKMMQDILRDKLALEVSLDEIVLYSLSVEGKPVCKKQSEISFITKALLYQDIENWILSEFGDHISTFYAIPIVNMNAAYSGLIRKHLKTV